MPGAIWIASPSTWMFFTLIDSNVRKSTSHQRLFAVITPACARDAPGAVRRNDVQHVGLHVVRGLELRGLRRHVDVGQHVVRPVLDDALVFLGPGLLEQARLRRDVRVAVEDQHLDLRLRALEVPRDLARALVGSRRAAIRRDRDRERVDAAVGHRLELLAQRHRLRSGLPRVQDRLLRAPALLEPGHAVVEEVDARRQHEAVVGQARARSRVRTMRLSASTAVAVSRTTSTPRLRESPS